MSYMDYVIHKNKKHLRIFLEFCFNVGCTSNMSGAPTEATLKLFGDTGLLDWRFIKPNWWSNSRIFPRYSKYLDSSF